MDAFKLKIPRPDNFLTATKPVRVLGIDLGTTNSAITEVYWSPEQPDNVEVGAIPVEQETPDGPHTSILVPSAVAIHGEKRYVGEGAKVLRAKAAELGLQGVTQFFFEAKNNIGLKYTYEDAPDDLKTPAQVEAEVLKLLMQAAMKQRALKPDRVVVTVPASFQLSQREDTIRAAELAGLELSGKDLLDEPIAAFIDHLAMNGLDLKEIIGDEANLVVFDFGGGTCDVAVMKLMWTNDAEHSGAAPRAVSRYHRLGGGDIDRAVFYQCLLPQIIKQNGLTGKQLGYEEKKLYLEPAFLQVAETLKQQLCETIQKRQGDKQALGESYARLPWTFACDISGRRLELKEPTLRNREFMKMLAPYIDRDLLHLRETEYEMSVSVFAPLEDSLDRAGMRPDDVDFCLLAGGSSLIPPVAEAIRAYFPRATFLHPGDSRRMQMSVSVGAALHAFYDTVIGYPLVPPVAHSTISIETEDGLVELVPAGSRLPYPRGGRSNTCRELSVPGSIVDRGSPLRINIVSGRDKRLELTRLWRLGEKAFPGDPLLLKYAMDENQSLRLSLTLADHPDDEPFSWAIENPLTHVVNPGRTRNRIAEKEERLRAGEIDGEERRDLLKSLGKLHGELNQFEKAIYRLSQLLRHFQHDDAGVLNRMGIYAGHLHDYEREERFYLRAAECGKDGSALFNLALSYMNRDDYRKALELIDQAIERDDSPCYYVAKAKMNRSLHESHEARQALECAGERFEKPRYQSDWGLGWYEDYARMIGDEELQELIAAERRRRKECAHGPALKSGVLPARMRPTAAQDPDVTMGM